MKTNEQIQKDVMDQIKWNPLLNSSEIGVFVKDGVVNLSGQVDTYLKKMEAEKEVKKVAGVRAIAEDIHVGISPLNKRTDAEIAQAVLNALKWNPSIPDSNIKIKVEDGTITLEGEVEWAYQRNLAKDAVAHLGGVRNVINLITIQPILSPTGVKQKINAAFQRNATIDAGKIQVELTGSKVTLKGQVRSFAEKEDAEQAAWSAPGILNVVNNLEVKTIEEPELSFKVN